jgi:hypothetical protein
MYIYMCVCVLNFLLFLDLFYGHIMYILQLTSKIKLLVLSSPLVVSNYESHKSVTLTTIEGN